MSPWERGAVVKGLTNCIITLHLSFWLMYWNIGEILTKQRRFNFINGARSIGKTYTTQKFLIKRGIEQGEEFIYLCRTQAEKQEGIFGQAFQKVLNKEFPTTEFKIGRETIEVKKDGWVTLGYCIAFSEYMKIKRRSYPFVKYILFDEYMLEEKDSSSYFKGWKEPDVFLNLYQTIDRDEDRVVCFFLGNNTTFNNPYHMHPAFNIPYIPEGKIWMSKNVLFQRAVPSEELRKAKQDNEFLKMIEGTDYGNYAVSGVYQDDNEPFIEDRTQRAYFYCTIKCFGGTFGVWVDNMKGRVYIDNAFDPYATLVFALTVDDHNENTLITKVAKNPVLTFIVNAYKAGLVRFTKPGIKAVAEKGIRLLL